jgi:hypothetical protein
LIEGRLAKPMDMPEARVVCPGDISKSALYQRASVTGALQMPPLARNLVDEEALAVLGKWIDQIAHEARH